jgi:hypothetical protein
MYFIVRQAQLTKYKNLSTNIQVQALKNAIKWKYKNVIPISDHLQALKNAIKLQILDAKFPTW